jgi:hypothetical protein
MNLLSLVPESDVYVIVQTVGISSPLTKARVINKD